MIAAQLFQHGDQAFAWRAWLDGDVGNSQFAAGQHRYQILKAPVGHQRHVRMVCQALTYQCFATFQHLRLELLISDWFSFVHHRNCVWRLRADRLKSAVGFGRM